MTTAGFGPKLDLVLKALSLSRGRLAAELRVDKSLVGRWVAGSVTPSSHNLAALTAFVASRRDGFTLLDWDSDLETLSATLGIDLKAKSNGADKPEEMLPLPILPAVRAETERRGSAYEGFWELLLPSFIGPGRVMRAQAIIRRERGILRMRMGVPVYESEGWLLPLEHHLYGVLVDPRVQAMQLMMLNGDVHPRVTLVDGIVMAGGSNRFMTPTAAAIVFQRKGNLTGDVDADDRTYTEAREAEQAFVRGSLPSRRI